MDNDELTDDIREVAGLGNLADQTPIPPGTHVRVLEDGITYTSVGQTLPEIAARLSWTQGTIWMPDHVLRDIALDHPVIVDPIQVAQMLLQAPISVHIGRNSNQWYFLGSGPALRAANMLTSRSVPYVDAVVELRRTSLGSHMLRLFHLSPATRNKGGARLWP